MSGLKDTCGKILVERWMNWNIPNSGVASNRPLSLEKLIEHSDRPLFKGRNHLPVRRLVKIKFKGILVKWLEAGEKYYYNWHLRTF